jgi:hypothetical protein
LAWRTTFAPLSAWVSLKSVGQTIHGSTARSAPNSHPDGKGFHIVDHIVAPWVHGSASVVASRDAQDAGGLLVGRFQLQGHGPSRRPATTAAADRLQGRESTPGSARHPPCSPSGRRRRKPPAARAPARDRPGRAANGSPERSPRICPCTLFASSLLVRKFRLMACAGSDELQPLVTLLLRANAKWLSRPFGNKLATTLPLPPRRDYRVNLRRAVSNLQPSTREPCRSRRGFYSAGSRRG